MLPENETPETSDLESNEPENQDVVYLQLELKQ